MARFAQAARTATDGFVGEPALLLLLE